MCVCHQAFAQISLYASMCMCIHPCMCAIHMHDTHTRHTHTHMSHHISLTFENGGSLDLWIGLHSIVADYFHAGGEAKMVVTYAGPDTGGVQALVQPVHEADLDNSTALQPIEMPQQVCACLVSPRFHLCLSLSHTQHTQKRTRARTHTHTIHA